VYDCNIIIILSQEFLSALKVIFNAKNGAKSGDNGLIGGLFVIFNYFYKKLTIK